MKCVAAVVMSLHALVGAMQAQAKDEPQGEKLPEGRVTVEYVPTVQVEAKRWALSDEVAQQRSELVPRFNEWVAELTRRDLKQLFSH